MTAAFSNFYEDATKKLSIRRNKKKKEKNNKNHNNE
ncbi:unnamed protein product [Oikopleura dioica]|uniref:Uncharacterized protein n=1 Tax=Oikopleura dioica TaxID=34765 RepID=E4WR36_OIKDI|nr:unnamed protein product [Oikopleura dioica]